MICCLRAIARRAGRKTLFIALFGRQTQSSGGRHMGGMFLAVSSTFRDRRPSMSMGASVPNPQYFPPKRRRATLLPVYDGFIQTFRTLRVNQDFPWVVV